jgi:hypothetical protein
MHRNEDKIETAPMSSPEMSRYLDTLPSSVRQSKFIFGHVLELQAIDRTGDGVDCEPIASQLSVHIYTIIYVRK